MEKSLDTRECSAITRAYINNKLMISESRSAALVGRPNVGKSRLFNRLVGRRVSIVHDEPGITRDVVSQEVEDFILMDTGGIGMKETKMSSKEMNAATEDQVGFALQAASLILLVVDGIEGLTAQDEIVANMLRRYGKKTILVVNKIDKPNNKSEPYCDSFYKLGFDEILTVSAEHGHGADVLLTMIEECLPEAPQGADKAKEDDSVESTRICFTGRPNVGKSSLANALLKTDRLIVSDIPGTTRDSVAENLEYLAKNGETWNFQLIDTAGLRRASKIDTSVEYFSAMHTEQSIVETNIVFLVIDALEGVTKLDKKLAGGILQTGRALAIIVSKWDFAMKQFSKEPVDGYDNVEVFQKSFEKAVRKELFFLPKSPIIFTSAKENYSLERILEVAKTLKGRIKLKLPTSKLNATIIELMERQKPPVVLGKRFKAYYSVQVGNNPFLFKIFCNKAVRLDERYRRYLQSGLIHAFNLDGCPIGFELVGKPPRLGTSLKPQA